MQRITCSSIPQFKLQWSLILTFAVATAFLLHLGASSAGAQPKVTFGPAKNGRIDPLVPVMAQAARCVAISDVHGLLAFGHDRTYPDAHVTLVPLDAKGTPAAFAIPIKLPRPKGLEKFGQYVTGVAFHPKLPLLYVWQDLSAYYANPPVAQPAELNLFDHLLVFNIAKETPELLVSMCRGTEYIYGQQGGTIAVDDSGSFLYVPNLRELKNAGSLRIGRFPLDGDGLPALLENDAKEPAAARAKKLAEINAVKPFSPPQMTPPEYVHLFHVSGFGTGHSFHPLGKDAVISAGFQGLMTWRPDEKNSVLNGVPLKYTGHTMVGIHRKLPVLFAVPFHPQHADSIFRVEQVDGYLTLLPRQYLIPDARLTSPPVVLTKSNQVAVGGQYQVYLVQLDDRGFPVDGVVQTQVNCPNVHALIYSERFDRLYVGVEVSK